MKWWAYECATIKRAFKETEKKKFLGWGFVVGVLAYVGQMEAGLHTPHDTLLFILIAFGSALVGVICGFLIHLFTLPAKLAAEQEERFNSTVATKDSEINSLRQEKEQLQQQLERLPEKPFVSVEGLIMPYQVQDFSGFPHGIPVGLDRPKIKVVNKFFVKVRNQGSFQVNIDTIGFTIKDNLLRGYFVDDSKTPISFPYRLEARASLTVRFFKVEAKGYSLKEIDGLYVETGCGYKFKSKDSQFAKWSLTADIRTMN